MRDNVQLAPPGDLVYLSERKLLNLAVHFGLKTGGLKADVDVEGSAGLSAGIPGVGKVSAKGSVRAEHTDPARRLRAVAKLLDEVVERLGGERLPNLDSGEDVREAGWFRFHRRLRFGVGHADVAESLRALIVVDREHVPAGLAVPGLLLNGSLAHVLAPYGSDELVEAGGARSGSGTDHLFAWLDNARRALELDPNADLDQIDASPFKPRDRTELRNTDVALDMYRLFAEERWVDLSVVPRLLHAAPCEGVAQASFVAVGEDTTVVMGSPLFLRIRALPEESDGRGRRSAGRLRRLFRRH